MPEIIEVEVYRQLAHRLVGSTITAVEVPDAWFIKGGATPAEVESALVDAVIADTNRIGKLLMIDLGDERPTLGLRFGMTGRLVIDGDAPIEQLLYGSGRDEPRWNRFAFTTADGARLRLSDPRRLGGVELDPAHHRLGPDAWTITPDHLREVLDGSRAPLKARLLDQHRIAGLGNLLVDETLWRSGIDPARPSRDLRTDEIGTLAAAIRETITDLHERGGSHLGDLQAERHREGRCPLDGAALERRTIGGRTTYSCPRHQR